MFLVFDLSFGQLQWGSYGVELDDMVTTVFTDTVNDILYVGGQMGHLNGQVTPGIISYDGQSWSPVGTGISSAVNTVYAIAVYHDTVYIGGTYTLGALKKWNGTAWVDVGSTPIYGGVFDLEVIDDELWVAGVFDSIGGLAVNSLARWNGNEWKTAYDFPPNLNGSTSSNRVVEVTEYKGDIYIGGNLNNDDYLSEMAMWDGIEWKEVGEAGIMQDGFSAIERMVVFKGDLYVMGSFQSATGNADDNIMRWNGEEWLRCGGGTDKRVYDAVVYQDKLWITEGGESAGGVKIDGLAIWDGEQWCSPGNLFTKRDTLKGLPAGIAVYRDTLIIGGSFTEIDGADFSRIAYWAGAGDVDTCGVIWPNGIVEQLGQEPLALYPNPVNEVLYVQLSDELTSANVSVMSIDGRLVWSANKTSKSGLLTVPTSKLASGVYLVHLQGNGQSHAAKFIKQ